METLDNRQPWSLCPTFHFGDLKKPFSTCVRIHPTLFIMCVCFLPAVVECAETTRDCRVTPEFNTSQCIFYPVKEEEREVLVGGSQSSSEKTATEMSHNAMQTELHEGIHLANSCLFLRYCPFYGRLWKNIS